MDEIDKNIDFDYERFLSLLPRNCYFTISMLKWKHPHMAEKYNILKALKILEEMELVSVTAEYGMATPQWRVVRHKCVDECVDE